MIQCNKAMPNLLVTGDALGIGRATCILAASRGWSVAINYVSNEHAALDTARDVERHGAARGRCYCLAMLLTKRLW